jgi:predicted Fe-Mo cluster-binding NifX family protein
MMIAVATEGKNVSQHFGHCEGFQVYSVEDNKPLGKKFLPNPGHRPGFLPVYLKEQAIDVIIAGGMGGAAQQLFRDNNIAVYVGIQGDCDEAVQQYIQGNLRSSGSVCHEHEQEGSCHS